MPLKSLLQGLSYKQLNQIKAQILTSSNPHTLNTLLASFVNSNPPQNALILYNQMLQNPYTHNHFSFNYALKACCLTRSFVKGQEIHGHVLKIGHFSHTFLQNSLTHFYVLNNNIVYAYRVFQAIDFPDVVSWTSIISGFSKCGFEDYAIVMFSVMNVDPNANALVSVLSACSSVKVANLGKSVHCYRLKNLSEDNLILDNALLYFYVKVGALENAQYLFDKMPKRDVVSWSTLVSGFAQSGFCKNAISIFEQMLKGEVKPNEATIVSVLAACASLGSLSLGQWVHSYIKEKRDITLEGNVGNALVNMYVKCGNIAMAIHVFQKLKTKDVVSWSTIISGVAMNGLGHHALPLFGLMLVHGVAPDDVTFIGLLTACSHTGLVDQGLMFYRAMVNVYGIMAQVKHCACVVDLYGRAGLLKEAEDFVRDMRVEPDGALWGALLNACKIHGDEVRFERISKGLVEKGASAGAFALVSNVYANSSRWDESMEVREVMADTGLKKMAGFSRIEIDNNA